jgi:hypothetical protein
MSKAYDALLDPLYKEVFISWALGEKLKLSKLVICQN